MLIQTLRRWFDSRRDKACLTRFRRRLFLEPLEDRSLLSTFMVTNTDDGGPGSLRSAMIDAENTPNVGGPDRIEFNIPGSGVHVIQPITPAGKQQALPVIRDPVIIDGYTQPRNDGSGLLATPNTLAVGDNAVLQIEINGSLMATGTHLFVFAGNHSTVRGLAVTHVPQASFKFSEIGAFEPGNDNTIVGNFINTDAGGLTYQGGDGPAILIIAGSGNVIGGPAPADRNVIAPGSFVPTATITMQSGSGNTIQGNYIGVNKDGTAALQSPFGGFGIDISTDSGSNKIGGTATGEGNVIVATLTGIRLTQGNTGSNFIQGNFIGTNAAGTAGLGGGQFGIDAQGSSDTIRSNVISGFSTGITISPQGGAALESGPTIQGNKIGTDFTGTLAIPNTGDGISIVSSPAGGIIIGGTHPGDGNTIAFNGRFGVFVNFGSGCSILGNSIFANGNLGINLNGALDGFFGPVTANDAGDGDGDANGLQNYPVLTDVVGGSSTTVTGTLNSTPDTTFRLEFFASDAADPSGNGEGQTFIGFTTVTTDGNGDVSYTATLPIGASLGQVISATATDPSGNTSEFAADVTVMDVANTPPVITSFTGPSTLLVGQAGFFGGTFIDPDTLDTWTATVNFGDGTGDRPMDTFSGQTFGNLKAYASPGTYNVTVTLTDNHGGSDTDSLTVTVTGNTPPVIDSLVGPTVGVQGQPLNYFGFFSDPDPDTWNAFVNFGDGSGDQPLDFNSHKSFGFQHVFADSGIYTVTVTVADNHGGVGNRSLDVTVTDNTPPNITSFTGPATGLVGQAFTYKVTFNDPDPDTWTGTINFGDVTGDQQFAAAPGVTGVNKTYLSSGTYTVVVTIADNHGGSDSRSLTTTITDAPNTPPHAVADAVSLTTGTSVVINVLANDTDPDGDPLTVTAVTQPASGHGIVTINANGTLTYKQTVYANGTEFFTYTISDGHGGTAIATVTVTVGLPARIGIDMLRSQVQHAGLRRGLQISLDSTLRAAQQALARGNSRAAANVLGAFAYEVRALKRARLLPASLADLWLLEDANILAEIGHR